MPVARGINEDAGGVCCPHPPIEHRNHGVPFADRQRASSAEIALHIHDDECIATLE
jgi:hypothetical protein